jgi:hypothetical protein
MEISVMDNYWLALCFGFFASHILGFFGVLTGQKAVDYYAEVHLSTWNSFIHTLGMPFTYMGLNLLVPALFKMKDPWMLQFCVFVVYMTHYATIDFTTTLVTTLIYYQVVKYSYNLYMKQFTSHIGYFFIGLAITTVALLIQEFIGHYMGGDEPSRAEGVFNAIIYAKFYSVQHIVNLIRH